MEPRQLEEHRQSLEEARATTLRLTDDLSDTQARLQPHPDLSPICWHLGHIAWQEEVFFHRKVLGLPPMDPALDGLLDPFHSPKLRRRLDLPPIDEIRSYASHVRERTLDSLERVPESGPADLLDGGWVFRFLANHERQHGETIAVVRLLSRLPLLEASKEEPPTVGRESPSRGEAVRPWVLVPGGPSMQGSEDPEGWDNERGPHLVDLPSFRLGTRPVTNGEWLCFMEAGGYGDERLWEEGWSFKEGASLEAPLHWERGKEGGWERFTLEGWREVDPSHPVAHVSWYEARAYAKLHGGRLPTEAEWERAAGWDPVPARQTRWPSGDLSDDTANVGLTRLGTSPSRSRPASCGAVDLQGNIWEWTLSPFLPYPGFRPGPYRGYSEPWFGASHRVLRGGSYLTHPFQARSAFRNWFHPGTRWYPTGLRLVWGVGNSP